MTEPTAQLPRCEVLGINVSAINMAQAVDFIGQRIERRQRTFITITGVHGVMESQRDAKLRAIHNRAGLVTPDGMPLVWVSKCSGHPQTERVYGPDLMLGACQASVERGWSHYFYGGGEGVADQLAERLTARMPGLEVAGKYCPPFAALDDAQKQAIARRINASGADIVWVGLSTPKQERWMDEFRPWLDAPVLIGVGAAFDFHAGLKRQAPRWMQRSGLEWFYRLCSEPRRLGMRYLRNNPAFVRALAASWLRSAKTRT